jgi:hypothetical protein
MNSIEEFNNSNDINVINKIRINYYLANVNKEIIVSRSKNVLFDDKILLDKENYEKMEVKLKKYYDKYVRLTKYFDTHYIKYSCYFKDLYNYLKYYKEETGRKNIECIYYFGDSVRFKDTPCFIKARSINSNDYSVLLNLNTERHIGMLKDIPILDIPFDQKNNKILWRGTDTAYNDNDKRNKIILKYQNHKNENIDIKFTKFVHERDMSQYNIAKKMNIEEMLKYKFLLSLEGNDVATNLKWILLSNSVVIMAKPTRCSWFMEDMLIPFVHYVPLNDDNSNIEEMYNWCMANLDKCKAIAQNATKYMKKFLNDDNEKYVITQVIKGYFDKVKFID